MGYSQQMASYQMASETVQKTRQLVMLYDAVIRLLKQARSAMEEKRFADRFNMLQKASNIVMSLHSALDYERGGEISQILNNFYTAMDIRMIGLNRTNSVEECDKIIDEIKIMRDAWDKIDREFIPPSPITSKTEESTSSAEKAGADFSA